MAQDSDLFAFRDRYPIIRLSVFYLDLAARTRGEDRPKQHAVGFFSKVKTYSRARSAGQGLKYGGGVSSIGLLFSNLVQAGYTFWSSGKRFGVSVNSK